MWLQWIFSVACLAVGGYYAASLITRRGERRDDGAPQPFSHDLSHLTMALGMAAMFSPIRVPVPHLMWVVVFGLSAAWFASSALREGPQAQRWGSADTTVYHLVANLAMLFMLRAPGHQAATGSAGGAGHEGHASASAGGWLDGPIGTLLAVVLIGYFVVHTGRALGALFRAAGAAQPELVEAGSVAVVTTRNRVTSPRVAASCHVVMGIAMAVMVGLML